MHVLSCRNLNLGLAACRQKRSGALVKGQKKTAVLTGSAVAGFEGLSSIEGRNILGRRKAERETVFEKCRVFWRTGVWRSRRLKCDAGARASQRLPLERSVASSGSRTISAQFPGGEQN